MGSGRAIKKKVQSCCDSCNSRETIIISATPKGWTDIPP